MTLRQGLIIGGIFIAGVAIDRAFVTTQPTASIKQDSDASLPAPILTPAATTPAVELQQFSSSPGQIKKALEAILKETDPRQRMTDLQSFINTLKPGEYSDALKRIRRLPGSSDRDLASRLLISQWVQSDPNGALQFAASNAGYENIAEDVFQQEAANGVQGAIDRAMALPNPDLRYQALRGIVSYLADTDPNAARARAKSRRFSWERTAHDYGLSRMGERRSGSSGGTGREGFERRRVAFAGQSGGADMGQPGPGSSG
jgi:hypothetical protein